jgi:hypothetical protein
MEGNQVLKVNVKETVEMSVADNVDFHFYVDELTADDYMPTYAGKADEKYTFEEMDDAFFEFLQRKVNEDGLFIRLVFATGFDSTSEKAVFELEYADKEETFTTDDMDSVLVFECADYGVKIKGDSVAFGATVYGGCGHVPYFAEFGSVRGNREYLSLENPLNKHILGIMEDMVVLDD